ncbi:MAG TPA: MFS transporter [Amycolatopsis sp.]|nr:MFS transporter [Amycolatopsis sp.]
MTPSPNIAVEAAPIAWTRRRMTLVAAVFVYAILGYAISTNMLVPLLPSVEKAYRMNAVLATWVTLSTLLAGALFVPSLCRIGDLLARRKQILLVSLGAVAIGGAIDALSDSVPLLLSGRALTGIGAAAMPMMSGIVAEVFPEGPRKVTIALTGSGLFTGAGGGGVLASLVIERPDGFRLLFWLIAAISALAVLLVAAGVPKTGRPAATRPPLLDLPGAIGFVLPVTALLIAFSYATEWGWSSPRFIGLVLIGIALLPVWVVIQLRRRAPLVDMVVFLSRPVWTANVVSVLVGFAIFGSISSASTLIQLPPVPGLGGQGASVLVATLVVLPAEMMIVWMAPIVGYLTRRIGKGFFLMTGPLVQCVGYLVLLADHGSVGAILLAVSVIGTGTGLVGPAWGLVYVEDVAPEHVGRVYGNAPILSQGVGGSISGAVFAAILTYRHLPELPLPAESAFRTFWWLAVAATLAAACVGAVYLRTYGRVSVVNRTER